MKYVCQKCGSSDIEQEISAMVDPNSKLPIGQLVENGSWEWNDYYYCNDCEDTVQADEID